MKSTNDNRFMVRYLSFKYIDIAILKTIAFYSFLFAYILNIHPENIKRRKIETICHLKGEFSHRHSYIIIVF